MLYLSSIAKSYYNYRCFKTSGKIIFKTLPRCVSTIIETSDVLTTRTTLELLEEGIQNSLIETFGDVGKATLPMVTPAKTAFGDYQTSAALPLSKSLRGKPHDIAAKLLSNLKLPNIIESTDISGPGFINLHLKDTYIEKRLLSMLKDPQRMGINPIKQPKRIIIDFSSPNIAKEMHVGHLRSTIIGDSLSRIFEFHGHDVLRLNHVGDWGTQFGMLIHYLRLNHPDALNVQEKDTQSLQRLEVEIGDLVEFYKLAKKRFDEDEEFKELARKEVVKLQAGDEESIRAWKTICVISRIEFQKIYDQLNVRLEERGESFYNPYLPSVVQTLRDDCQIVVESEGAQCIFLPGYKNADGTPSPLIVQKSDGGYLYATTDLAALKHRIDVEKADQIIYITDAGQAMHFQMVFEAARSATGFIERLDSVRLTHVPFGLVLGEDGKKIKSRAGDSVKLRELLDEAVRIARDEIIQRNNQSNDTTPSDVASIDRLAHTIGIASVKYADLAMNRESNYKFSYKKMLSLSGNTAPYMLYAFVRIEGIKRKAANQLLPLLMDMVREGGVDPSKYLTKNNEYLFDILLRDAIMRKGLREESISKAVMVLSTMEEKALAKHLIRLDEVLLDVMKDLLPNRLCDYIFELSQKFNQFYENCPVLKADNEEIQLSRTVLCSLTSGTLKLCLNLLGIETVDQL